MISYRVSQDTCYNIQILITMGLNYLQLTISTSEWSCLAYVVYAVLCALPLGKEYIYKLMEYLVGNHCSINIQREC